MSGPPWRTRALRGPDEYSPGPGYVSVTPHGSRTQNEVPIQACNRWSRTGEGGGQTPSTGGVHELGESVPTEPRPSSPGSRALVPVCGGRFPTLRGAGLGDQVLSSPAGRGKRELDRPQVTGAAAGPRAGPKASVSSPRPLTAPALHGDPPVGRPASFPGQVVHPPS